jgi:hypothetical protein
VLHLHSDVFSPRQTKTKTPVPSNQLSHHLNNKGHYNFKQQIKQVPENTYHIHHPIIPSSQCPASTHQGFELPFLGIFQFHLLGRVLAAELLDVGLQDEAASMGFGKEHCANGTNPAEGGVEISDNSGYFQMTSQVGWT